MPISPLDVVTEGYLNSPLSVCASGYIYVATVGIDPESPNYTGSAGKTRKVQGRSVRDIQSQLRDEETILHIILIAVEQDLI